jgi:hypothetical protein
MAAAPAAARGIETDTGDVLGQGLSGPATTRLGIDKAWELDRMTALVEAALEEAGIAGEARSRHPRRHRACGIGRKGALEALQAMPHPFASIDFVSDGFGACLGAHSGQDGAIVIAGTGSIGLGFVEGRELRVGGYGFPISDEAAAPISACKPSARLAGHDGRHERPPCWRGDAAFPERADGSGRLDGSRHRHGLCALAPMVMRHADQGDRPGGASSKVRPSRSIRSCACCSKRARRASRCSAASPAARTLALARCPPPPQARRRRRSLGRDHPGADASSLEVVMDSGDAFQRVHAGQRRHAEAGGDEGKPGDHAAPGDASHPAGADWRLR